MSGGQVCPGGIHAQRCACPEGGICAWGGMHAWEACVPGGACMPPLWTEFLTHAYENITFPQLPLRAVIIMYHRLLNILY